MHGDCCIFICFGCIGKNGGYKICFCCPKYKCCSWLCIPCLRNQTRFVYYTLHGIVPKDIYSYDRMLSIDNLMYNYSHHNNSNNNNNNNKHGTNYRIQRESTIDSETNIYSNKNLKKSKFYWLLCCCCWLYLCPCCCDDNRNPRKQNKNKNKKKAKEYQSINNNGDGGDDEDMEDESNENGNIKYNVREGGSVTTHPLTSQPMKTHMWRTDDPRYDVSNARSDDRPEIELMVANDNRNFNNNMAMPMNDKTYQSNQHGTPLFYCILSLFFVFVFKVCVYVCVCLSVFQNITNLREI